MKEVISVHELSKKFLVRKNFPGILGAVKGLFYSEVLDLSAIQELSFSIRQGERVAFIGPNGAGKSTTIKMLTGILYPTSGEIRVLGITPWQDRMALGYEIGTVFGQRTQLWTIFLLAIPFISFQKFMNCPLQLIKSDYKN